MNRLLVSSRIRLGIDLLKCEGMYEFSLKPPSIFTPDGSLYYPKDKATIATDLQNLQSKEGDEDIENGFSSTRKVVLIDDMAILNKINIATS